MEMETTLAIGILVIVGGMLYFMVEVAMLRTKLQRLRQAGNQEQPQHPQHCE